VPLSLLLHHNLAERTAIDSDAMEEARLRDLLQRVMSVQSQVESAAFKRRRTKYCFAVSRARERGWRFTTRVVCPACHASAIRRSHRRSQREYLLSAFVLPFRCMQCETRFFISRVARV